MNAKERVRRSLRGETTDRAATGPLAVHFCAAQRGITLRDYTLDPVLLSDCVIRYFEKYQPDAIWLSADTWITAQAMGCKVRFPDHNQPMGGTGESLVTTPADVNRIPRPDPSSQGRMPLMLEALSRIKKTVGEDAFVVACFDQMPFSLGCALMEINRMMLALVDDPPFVEAVLERCGEYAAAYAEALAAAGADLLSSGDSPAGLIGPERYRAIALPAERRVIERLHRTTRVPVSLHICGDSSAILPDMASSGADVIEFDYQVDASEACRAVGPDVALWGNLDPVGLLAQGTPAQVARAARASIQSMRNENHARFVLSSGCTLAVETPEKNLRALLAAAG